VAEYRNGGIRFVAGLIKSPDFVASRPMVAFYAWVNIENTGLSRRSYSSFCWKKAGVGELPHAAFGPGGKNKSALLARQCRICRGSFGKHQARFGSMARRGFALICRFSMVCGVVMQAKLTRPGKK